MSYTLSEREYLQKLLSEGKSFRAIADLLGRNVSSISREVARNRSKYKPKKESNNKYQYHAWRAQTLSIYRRRKSLQFRLSPGSEEWNYIVEKLKLFWTPEQIVFRWRLEHPDRKLFGVSTLYRYIKANAFEGIKVGVHLRRRNKHKVNSFSNYNSIQPDRIIPDWPEEIKKRTRLGDWEGDTIYGGIGKGLLVTLVDRKSKLLCAGLLECRNADKTKQVIKTLLSDKVRESISFDNGSEFSEFRAIEKELNTTVYFAEPHKPWQRGTNENTNDILRFFFPKGFNFHSITQDDVDFVVNLLNNRPRKTLGWKTPNEIFFGKSVALT